MAGGATRIAGIDEVGRGPLAGPVVAAAAVIDRTRAKRSLLRLIDDSKKLDLEKRETAYAAIVASEAVKFAVAEASVEEIDRLNILQATFLAMRRAVQALGEAPLLALVDGNKRTAWASAWTFLHINGDELAPDFDVDRAEELMNTVATQELELSEIASALRGFAVAS